MKKIKKHLILSGAAALLLAGFSHAEIKTEVDLLINRHGLMLGDITNPTSGTAAGRVQIGIESSVLNNLALAHANEVAEMITGSSGQTEASQYFQECCWRPQPSVYSNFVVGSQQDVLSASDASPSERPEEMYNSEDLAVRNSSGSLSDAGRDGVAIANGYGTHMASVLDQIVKVRDTYAGELGQNADDMDNLSYGWMEALVRNIPASFDFSNTSTAKLPPDSILSRLVWNWSYQIKKYREYRSRTGDYVTSGNVDAYMDEYRDYYAWSCIVCLGAGFYDTLGMYDYNDELDRYEANEYYNLIVALLSPDQQAWLAAQYDEGFVHSDGTSAPPLQVSLGLTLQSQETNNPPSLDEHATYGTHCHSAAEVYIPIDPMSLDKKLGGTALVANQEEGWNYDTRSYMAGYPNTSDALPEFGNFTAMQNQVIVGSIDYSFTPLNHGDIVYWEKYHNHAMHPGQRFQFSAWARVDRPWEGTYFPFDIDASDADATIDSQTGQAYASSCVDQVEQANVLYCDQPKSYYDNVNIVNQVAGAVLLGTPGKDLLIANTTGGSQLIGYAGDDCLIGGPGADSILGGDGADNIHGGGGADSISAGAGNDYINGKDGDDTINGNSGDDTIFGGAGADTLKGQKGNDTIDGGDGADIIRGGGGTDTCTKHAGDTVATCETLT